MTADLLPEYLNKVFTGISITKAFQFIWPTLQPGHRAETAGSQTKRFVELSRSPCLAASQASASHTLAKGRRGCH